MLNVLFVFAILNMSNAFSYEMGFHFNYLSAQSNNPWKQRLDKDGITVHTRISESNDMIEFRAIAVINAPISQLITIMNDVQNYPKWIADIKQAKTLLTKSDSTRYDYFEIEVPWPFSNRDISELVLHRYIDSTQYLLLSTNKPDFISKNEGVVRINKAKGLWLLQTIGTKRTKVIYELSSDPGGYIPLWVINLLIVDGPFQTLSNLKAYVKTRVKE